MPKNTVVTACDRNYAWGVWLLAVSMRQHGMTEPLLVGTYDWPQEWLDDIQRIPGVNTIPLPTEDKRCVTCSKPIIMLAAETEFMTWVDCDGIFVGNCSARIIGEEGSLYLRPRVPSEVRELYHRERKPGDPPETIPPGILSIWQRDVGERQDSARQTSCSAALISAHRSQRPFLEKWRQQILKVLPTDVGVVNHDSLAYFQTDESVLNSLLCFAADAPPVTEKYRADKLDTGEYYIHFAYNPKPWQMWTKYALRFYAQTLDTVEYGVEANWLPQAKLPYTLQRRYQGLCRLLAPFAANVARAKKLRRKISSRLRRKGPACPAK
ncbi:MAG: hypothetical protein BWX73_00965 [Lentisphaerae bacterium ADurb.Bin082]|nr:MAG: hypothetical protein BWX73_00965 [Lentisphaerae bacterium ADurb.Bin082]